MDQEIQAMASISDALGELDDAAKARVLRWAADRFGISGMTGSLKKGAFDQADESLGNDEQGSEVGGASPSEGTEEFDSFAELFAQANPSSEAYKVLVAGYWHQVVCSDNEITSAKLNKDLRDLGHSIVNINQKFDSLMAAKPQLAIQLKKSGSSKQARKKYKITKAGIEKIEEMLGAEN